MSNYAPFEPLQESVKEKEQMKRKISLDNHKNIEQIVLKYNLKKLKSDYLDMNTYYIDSNGNILYSCAINSPNISKASYSEAEHIRKLNFNY